MKTIGEIVKKVPLCGCGDPDGALAELRAALEAIEVVGEDWDARWGRVKAWESRMPGGVSYLIWYMLDSAGLTEHGGSVPGWLTDDGERLLVFLRGGAGADEWFAA